MPFLQLPMPHMVTAWFKTALTIETTGKNPLVYIVWWTDTHNVGKFISTLIWQKFKRQLKGSVKEPNMFHNYETEKITLKAKKKLKTTRQKTCNYIKLFGSSAWAHHARRCDAINVILWMSADLCVVHDNLGWKNRATCYNCRFSAASLALQVIFIHRKHPLIHASCMTISGGRTKLHVIIDSEELAAVN